MHPIWDEPIMLLVIISIALGISFYLYVMVFVARFGRGGPGGGATLLPGWIETSVALGIPMVLLIAIFLIPYPFEEMRNESFAGNQTLREPLGFSRRVRWEDLAYFTTVLNVSARPGSQIRGNVSCPSSADCILRVFEMKEFEAWRSGQGGVVLASVSVPPGGESRVALRPATDGEHVFVVDGLPADSAWPEISAEQIWVEWVSGTREVSRKGRKTLFSRWLGY